MATPAKILAISPGPTRKRRAPKYVRIDVGDRINRLTVLAVRNVTKRFSSGSERNVKEVYVRCTCGREKWTNSAHVAMERVKSCGCLNYEPRCTDPHVRIARILRAITRTSARARGIAFQLDIEHIVAIAFLPCFYCEEPPNRQLDKVRPFAGAPIACHGIDRVDSALGYTAENVVTCCWQCNLAKLDFSAEAFLQHAERVAARAQNVRSRLLQRTGGKRCA